MIVLDTHAWVRWLHPELGQPLPAASLEQSDIQECKGSWNPLLHRMAGRHRWPGLP